MKRFLVGPPSVDAEPRPAARLEELRRQRVEITVSRRLWIAAGGVLVVIALVGLLAGATGVAIIVAVAAALAFAVSLQFGTWDLDHRIREAQIQVDVLGKAQPEDPTESRLRAYKLFKSAQYDLQRYYDLALRHSRIMLAAGLLCIALGVGVILAAGWLVLHPPDGLADDRELASQIIVGVLGAVAGVLTNYVAAVYMRMYAATSQALNDFHNRLVTTQHLFLGNYLAEKIAQAGTRDDALKSMAVELSKQ